MPLAMKRSFLLIGVTAGAIIVAGAIAIGQPAPPVAGTTPTAGSAVAKLPAAPASDDPPQAGCPPLMACQGSPRA